MEEYYSPTSFGMLSEPVPRPTRLHRVLIEIVLETLRGQRITVGSLLFDENSQMEMELIGLKQATARRQVPADPHLAGFVGRVMETIDSTETLWARKQFPVQGPWYPLSVVIGEVTPL